MNLDEIEQYADTIAETLKSTDDRFKNYAVISHKDKTFFFISNAFIEEKDGWVIIYSLNHGFFCYEQSELNRWESNLNDT